MKIFQKIGTLFGAILLASTLVLSSFNGAYAEELPDYRLQLSPARQDVGDLKPGETYTGTIKVQNTGKNPFNYRMSVSPYTVIDEMYTQDYDRTNQYTDIVEWIKFSKETGSLEPNTQDEITFTIKVPADVPAGGQYAILMAEIVNDENTNQSSGVAAIRRVGMLLYSNVYGSTRKTSSIIENKVPSILFNPPVTATSIVENTGNTHATAQYILQVYPLFGNEEVYTNEEEPAELTILPETRRYNSIEWPNAPHLGIFRVKQTVKIWDQTSTVEKVVFLCPIWFLFIILLLIFLIIFWIFTRVRNRHQERR